MNMMLFSILLELPSATQPSHLLSLSYHFYHKSGSESFKQSTCTLYASEILLFKGTSTDIWKTMFQKVLFVWSSMPIFSFTGYTLTELFRNLTIDDKFINKRVRLFIHQTTCREEKIICTSSQGCKIASYLFKKMCKQPLEEQKQSPEVFYKKSVFKNFLNLTGKNLCWSLF